jgi:hypothetical protein
MNESQTMLLLLCVLLLLGSRTLGGGAGSSSRTLDDAFRLIEAQAAELAALRAQQHQPPAAARRPGLFVVTDFGADPSGRLDSTLAIQRAFWNATEAMARGGTFERGDVFEPEVLFPSGHYTVSDTINLSNVRPEDLGRKDCGALGNDTTWCYFALLRVTGEGIATVEQLDPERDVFAGAIIERLSFSFMSLRGGLHQLHVGNNNTDQGFIRVQDCTFANASGAAIRVVGPSCQGCPAGVDDCPVDPHCPPSVLPQIGSYSSQVIVKDCMFTHNYQTLVVWSDWAVFSDSWISTNCDLSDAAVIENHDKLFISNILGVPCNKRCAHCFCSAARFISLVPTHLTGWTPSVL